MRNCPACSHPLSETDTYCTGCGRMAAAPVPVQTSPQPPEARGGNPPPQYAVQQHSYPPQAPPSSGGEFFCSNLLGFLFPVILLCISIQMIVFFLPSSFLSGANFSNITRQFLTMVPLVAGAVLSVRSRGLDLSLAGIMSLGGTLYGLSGSVTSALLACVIAGAASGAVITFLRVPSLYVGLGFSPILLGICYILTDGMATPMDFTPPNLIPVAAMAGLGCGFLYNFFSGTGTSKEERKSRPQPIVQLYLAYPLAGLLAGLSGIATISRMGVVAPVSYGGTSTYPLLIMIFAAVGSSKLLDNRIFPLLYACVILYLTRLLNNQCAMLSLSYYFQMLLEGIVTVIFLAVYALANWPFRAAGQAPAPSMPQPTSPPPQSPMQP